MTSGTGPGQAGTPGQPRTPGLGGAAAAPRGAAAARFRLGSRPEFLAALLAGLFSATDADGRPLGLRTRAPDDATVALLDAWATVADIISFYQERIASEGFLPTAVQPESVLALASLAARQPRPGVAASAYLAYTLSSDPADTAVLLSAGLKAQTVPGPGELPQTFETTRQLVARPSWNTLTLRTTSPLVVSRPGLPLLTELTVEGVSARLSPNDMMLLELADGGPPGLVTVASATADTAAAQTRVTLRVERAAALHAAAAALAAVLAATPVPAGRFQQALDAELAGLRSAAQAAQQAHGDQVTPAADKLTEALASVTGHLRDWAELAGVRGDAATAAFAGQLLTGLAGPAAAAVAAAPADPLQGTPAQAAPAASSSAASAAVQLTAALSRRSPASPAAAQPRAHEVFDSDADPFLRLLIGLRPALAGTLYPALAATKVGQPAVTSAAAMRVTAAPFGTQVPKQVITDPGKPPKTLEWPIDQTCLVTLTVPGGHGGESDWAKFAAALERQPLGVEVDCPAGSSDQVAGPLSKPSSVTVPFGGQLGEIELALTHDVFTVTYRGDTADSFSLTVHAGQPAGLEFRADGQASTWDPQSPFPLRATLGVHRLTVAWSVPRPGGPASAMTISVVTPLPLGAAAAAILTLDRLYDTILPGTWLVAGQGGARAADARGTASAPPADPVIARVLTVRTVVVHRYGLTGRVTELALDRPWTDPEFRLLSGIRHVVVHAQPEVLTLGPSTIGTDIGGDRLELGRLYAGLEAGRQVIVTGTRADLPAGSSVPAAEVATVAGIQQAADPVASGGSPLTTLTLAAPLAYRYQRASATVLGNIVPALQGETQQEVLGSGQPGQTAQPFTLSRAPVLATPSPAQEGWETSLTVTVDGQPWQQADRIGPRTPAHSYLTGRNADGQVTVTFPGALPVGSGNVSASYRVGHGGLGNVRAHQISQLVSRPLGVSGVDNPMPAAGGTDGDSPDALRAGLTTGLGPLGRLVTLADYADTAAGWAGVGKAAAVTISDGSRPVVHVTVAGADPAAPLDPAGGPCAALVASLSAAGDPEVPLVLAPAELALIVIAAAVRHDPAVGWPWVSASVRAVLLDAFGYSSRGLGQDVVRSEVLAAAHGVTGVLSVTVQTLRVVPASATAGDLARPQPGGPVPPVIRVPGARLEQRTAVAQAGETLSGFAARQGIGLDELLMANPGIDTVVFTAPATLVVGRGLRPARLAYLSGDVPGVLALQEDTS